MKYEDVPVVYTEISNDYDSFAEALVEHLKQRQEDKYLSKVYTYDKDTIKDDHYFKPFLDKAQRGDVLKFYVWNAGFLAYSEGYVLFRDDEQVARATTVVS